MNYNLLQTLNLSNFNFYFLVVDPFLSISLYPHLKNFHLIFAKNCPQLSLAKKQKAPYFCLQDHRPDPLIKNSGKLLAQSEVQSYIKKTCQKNNHQAAIIPFKPSAKIDFVCRQHHWTKISNPASLARSLEDKIKFTKLCQHHLIPIPPTTINTFTQKNYHRYQKQFGQLVIQTRLGWAGSSSHLSHQWSDIKDKIPTDTTVKFSPYLKNAYTLLNNCCLTKKGLIQSPSARQITNIKFLSPNPLATVGRQWPSRAPPPIQKQVHQISQKFALILNDLGYLGYFGLDFLVDGFQVYLQECNPRLTASFAFYHQLEQKNNITPLFLLHLAQFLPIKSNINLDLLQEQKRFDNKNIVGFQLNCKNQQDDTIKQISQQKPVSLTPATIQKLFQGVHQ